MANDEIEVKNVSKMTIHECIGPTQCLFCFKISLPDGKLLREPSRMYEDPLGAVNRGMLLYHMHFFSRRVPNIEIDFEIKPEEDE